MERAVLEVRGVGIGFRAIGVSVIIRDSGFEENFDWFNDRLKERSQLAIKFINFINFVK